MVRVLLIPALALVAAAAWAPPAAFAQSISRDIETCDTSSGDPAITACTRLINSGEMTRAQLASIHHNRAVEYEIKKNYTRSLADYNRSLELRPNDPDSLVGRGNAYNNTGKHDRAIEAFNEALEVKPGSLVARYNRGLAFARKGDEVKAREDYEAVIAGTPTDGADERSKIEAKKGLARLSPSTKP